MTADGSGTTPRRERSAPAGDPALRALAELGPFFAIELHRPTDRLREPWRSLAAPLDDALDRRVQAVRAALARAGGRQPEDIELRVAASVAHLGLVARIVAPLIGARALGLPGITARRDRLWWQDRLGGPFPLSVAVVDDTADPVGTDAVDAITDAIGRRCGVSAQVLWGNVGSAANGAARMIAVARPELAAAATLAADAMLADPRIDAGVLRSGVHFRRHSCCLLYRIDGNTAAVCGDCVLRR